MGKVVKQEPGGCNLTPHKPHAAHGVPVGQSVLLYREDVVAEWLNCIARSMEA